jgi:hypothetical protein
LEVDLVIHKERSCYRERKLRKERHGENPFSSKKMDSIDCMKK